MLDSGPRDPNTNDRHFGDDGGDNGSEWGVFIVSERGRSSSLLKVGELFLRRGLEPDRCQALVDDSSWVALQTPRRKEVGKGLHGGQRYGRRDEGHDQ